TASRALATSTPSIRVATPEFFFRFATRPPRWTAASRTGSRALSRRQSTNACGRQSVTASITDTSCHQARSGTVTDLPGFTGVGHHGAHGASRGRARRLLPAGRAAVAQRRQLPGGTGRRGGARGAERGGQEHAAQARLR